MGRYLNLVGHVNPHISRTSFELPPKKKNGEDSIHTAGAKQANLAKEGLDHPDLQHVAIKIVSDEYGDLWLCSGEPERDLGEDGAPTYTVAEAWRMIGLPKSIVNQVHAFKRVFGATVDDVIDQGASAQERGGERTGSRLPGGS